MTTIVVLRRFPGNFAVFMVSVITSFLLGAIYGGFASSPNFIAFTGVGVVGTAASFILVAGRFQPAVNSRLAALRLFRRLGTALVLQAALCITFVMVGYLTVDFAVLLYRKLLWG